MPGKKFKMKRSKLYNGLDGAKCHGGPHTAWKRECLGKRVWSWSCTLEKDEWKRPHKEEVRSKPLRHLGEEYSRRWEEPVPRYAEKQQRSQDGQGGVKTETRRGGEVREVAGADLIEPWVQPKEWACIPHGREAFEGL